MRFEQIFNGLSKEIDIILFEPEVRHKYRFYWDEVSTDLKKGLYYNIFVEKQRRSSGAYTPMPLSTIYISRQNPTKPDVSYLRETVILLHEFGHHQNILVKNKNHCLTKTGYIYYVKDEYQIKQLLKEEFMAWINAFKTLWSFKYVLYLNFWYKLMITLYMIKESCRCYMTYIDWAIDTKLIQFESRRKAKYKATDQST